MAFGERACQAWSSIHILIPFLSSCAWLSRNFFHHLPARHAPRMKLLILSLMLHACGLRFPYFSLPSSHIPSHPWGLHLVSSSALFFSSFPSILAGLFFSCYLVQNNSVICSYLIPSANLPNIAVFSCVNDSPTLLIPATDQVRASYVTWHIILIQLPPILL